MSDIIFHIRTGTKTPAYANLANCGYIIPATPRFY